MKSIFLLRHADAPYSGFSQQERVLSMTGIFQAEQMRTVLDDFLKSLDFVLCSGRLRARQTLRSLSSSFPVNIKLLFDDSLSQVSSGSLLEKIQWTPSLYKNMMIIGHNPGLSQFVADVLPQQNTKTLSPCEGVLFESDAKLWQEIGYNNLKFIKRFTPEI